MGVGDLVVYINGTQAEIGRIKTINREAGLAQVYYHCGETSALTKLKDLTLLVNGYCILDDCLGGKDGRD